MSSQTSFDEEAPRRNYRAPYSKNHPIPTIQRFNEHRSEVNEQQKQAEDAQHDDVEDDSKTKRAFNSVKAIFKGEGKEEALGDAYPTANRHTEEADQSPTKHDSSLPSAPDANGRQDEQDHSQSGDAGSTKQKGAETSKTKEHKQLSATEKAASQTDPKQKRKDIKHNKRDDGGRIVTDPVTHLPLVIRDSTEKDMKRAPPNEPSSGSEPRTTTGLSNASKSSSQLDSEKDEVQKDYEAMQKLFPPPSYDDAKLELERTYKFAITLVISIITVLAALLVFIVLLLDSRLFRATTPSTSHSWSSVGKEHGYQPKRPWFPISIAILSASGIGFAVVFGIREWLGKKVEEIWKDEVWDAARGEEEQSNNSDGRLPESTAWLNGLLASVWPLINPDLFASVVDMLEDVMQASLPKMIRMVSVDDLGQGSEAIRILGIRYLPTGAAAQSVDEEGNLKSADNKDANDRAAPGQGEEEDHEDQVTKEDQTPDSKKKQQTNQAEEEEQQAIREGMEAEQGDFVNMELAFAYRARSSGKTIKSKAKNAHLYLKFYLPGGIFVPVWVEVRGIIGTLRLRLQLTPDPPFFSLCTLTFLGQPRADLSCVPLSKHLPNLMDVPLISSFVQSSIDAALAEYVAPKSLTLDIKDMLVGDDFKKDTVARGVLVIFIKECKGFKEGDGGFGPIDGSSDSYVTCSWAKFGKTVTSTRVIEHDQHPIWHEWAYMLVTPEELNAEEKLRLQLWDSDKYTADDDLGRVEVDLKELMHSPKTKNKMSDREDRFHGEDPSEKVPGTISWSVGYYEKKGITDEQLSKQSYDKEMKTRGDLKKKVAKTAENKLREAKAHDESKEIDQQKSEDFKELEDALICASPPSSEYPSGILSIQIHNITGLAVESLNKKGSDDSDREDEAEQSDSLPSSYCTIMMNHKKIYRTRTKPKNAKPFFNAGTERFVRDWRNTEIMVSVRDNREGENNPLLGIVYLPLNKVFDKRSQAMDMYPLVGGIGFGRMRISMVFRSTELQLSNELLGWDYGTLEINSPVKAKQLPKDIQKLRIKLRSNLARAKMSAGNGEWIPKHGKRSVFLACRDRYSMPLVIEWRKSGLGPDSTPAFAVFWLQDIPDEEEKTITMKVWKGGKDNLKRATSCADYNGIEGGEREEPIGEIEVKLKFWRGLSGYHKSYSQKGKNKDIRDVMEVLDTVNDEIKDEDDDESSDSSDSEASKSDVGDDDDSKDEIDEMTKHPDDTRPTSKDEHHSTGDLLKHPLKAAKAKTKSIVDGHNASDDGSRGVVGQAQDYKDHHKQLHRKHRGIMQWKATRTADWAMGKVRHGKSRMSEVFEHHEKGQGVETEV